MSTSAERVARFRARRQRGVMAVVQVEVTEPLVRGLISDGWLEAQRDSGRVRVTKKAIGKALSALLSNCADG